jgi:hypothetical protein
MNERIKELAKQAGFEEKDGHISIQGVYMFNTYRMEKFAELIVKECADIAKHHVMNISTYADAEFVEKQIEEHFGVEE